MKWFKFLDRSVDMTDPEKMLEECRPETIKPLMPKVHRRAQERRANKILGELNRDHQLVSTATRVGTGGSLKIK